MIDEQADYFFYFRDNSKEIVIEKMYFLEDKLEKTSETLDFLKDTMENNVQDNNSKF